MHSTHTLGQAALRAAPAVQPTDQRENIYTYVINATEVGLALLHLVQQQMQWWLVDSLQAGSSRSASACSRPAVPLPVAAPLTRRFPALHNCRPP